jgi:hypothetical protein
MKKLVPAVLFTFLFALGAQGAHAEDAKTYSGLSCSGNDSDLKRSYSKVYNSSSTRNATAYCPGVNDSMNEGLASGSTIWVVDRHYTKNIRCTLATASSSSGYYTGYSSTRTSSGTNSERSAQGLTFPALKNMYTRGTYLFICTLPPKYNGSASSIYGYFLRED